MYKERIRETYERLSPGYRRVADFLLNHYQEAAFMTAGRIGRATEVDTTLVVRFAQRLGYAGYPELIADVQADVKRDLRAVYATGGPEDNTTFAMFQRSLVQDRNSLEYMLLHADVAVIEPVVELLEKAPRIYVIGEGAGVYLADLFTSRVLALGFPIRALPGDLITRVALSVTLGPGDLCIGLGTTRLVPGVAVALKIARSEGAHTVAIVGALTNPAAAQAEYVIHAPVQTIGVFPSLTSVLAILHSLIQVLTLRMGDRGATLAARSNYLFQQYAEAQRETLPSLRAVLSEYNPGSAE
ncbi:MAG: hypothetical protein CVU38_03165 [Chloroflexi bacterium HGW-Chloroflexi-1]|nr:MAG: hypothetical protein CVU38_03165 [Chloroflexi bacterium HGW-Chloroflexi-1]